MKRIIIAVAIFAAMAVCSSAMAIQLHWDGITGGIGGYYNTPSTNGIGYGLTDYHDMWSCEIVFDSVSGIPGYVDGSPLITFCVEWNEDLIGENDFTATLNTGAVKGGVSGQTETDFDPLSDQSAWLFTQYSNGATFGIADVNRRAAVVQEAIWSLEDELTWSDDYTETAGVIASADAAVNSGWTNQNVRVLNIVWADEEGHDGQDVLVIVPEPSSIVVLFGALGSFVISRRRKN
ncbi:PEP-CTERM sorting domain-containing protein [bacterium]|nr:PEP-CTERM sorting domain-containing protein [bacterium]